MQYQLTVRGREEGGFGKWRPAIRIKDECRQVALDIRIRSHLNNTLRLQQGKEIG